MSENPDETKITNAPAPWLLKGNGYILLYKFPKEFIDKDSFLTDELKDKVLSSIGGVMLIDYTDSNVGPYYELLFIPGLFRYKGTICFSISKIYVSSVNSMINGYSNWAIPKEMAEFKLSKSENSLNASVYKDGNCIFSIKLSENSFSIPFNNRFLPGKLIQKKEDKILITDFFTKGKISTIKLSNISSNGKYFPDINNLQPFLNLKATNFSMVFESAKITTL